MRVHHAFWLTRRTRRVEDIRQVTVCPGNVGCGRGLLTDVPPARRVPPTFRIRGNADHLEFRIGARVGRRERALTKRVRKDHPDPTVEYELGETRRRKPGVEGNVGSACLPDAIHCDDGIKPFREIDPDAVARGYAKRDEGASRLVCPTREGLIAEYPTLESERLRIRGVVRSVVQHLV